MQLVSHSRSKTQFPLILLSRSPLKSPTSSSSSSLIETAVPYPPHPARMSCPIPSLSTLPVIAAPLKPFFPILQTPLQSPQTPQSRLNELLVAGRLASRLPLQLHSKRVLRCT
ncbi:hypothetical protein ACLOJK_004686 [Asimina triloba]